VGMFINHDKYESSWRWDMNMLWNDLDDPDVDRERLRSLLESSPGDEGSTVSELKDELSDLWEQGYWKKRQWTHVSPFITHASAE
jgi:hypothetical protein